MDTSSRPTGERRHVHAKFSIAPLSPRVQWRRNEVNKFVNPHSKSLEKQGPDLAEIVIIPTHPVAQMNQIRTASTCRECKHKATGEPPKVDGDLKHMWATIQQRCGTNRILKPFTSLSTPLWIAQADQVRAYRSLTTVGQVRDHKGRLKDLSVVVDSGAALTLISERVWKQSRWVKNTLSVTKTKLQTASGEQLEVKGVAEVDVVFGDRSHSICAVVVADLAPAMLLGVDFLTKCGAVIDFQKMKLEIPGMRALEVQCGAPHLVRSREVVCVAAQSKAVVPCRVDAREGQVVVVQAMALSKNVHMARSIDRVKDGQILCSIINTSAKPLQLRKNQYINVWEGLPEDVKISDWTTKEVAEPLRTKQKVSWAKEMENAIFQVNREGVTDQDATTQMLFNGMQHLTSGQRHRLYQIIAPFRSIFVSGQATMPTKAKDQVVRIHGGENNPVALAPYRTPYWKRSLIDDQVQLLLDQDVIELSMSPWAAPVVLVEKPGQKGKWRLCIDYREMNKVVDTVIWPLPRMDDSIAQVADAKWFTGLDLAWGFWNLPLDERDRYKTAFITETGHYQWKRMPMGWQGAPPNFQRSMDLLLHGISGVFALCYIDDLLIFSDTFENHLSHVQEVCARLHKAGRSVRVEKAQWAKQEVKFLGFTVGDGKVAPIDSSVEKIMRVSPPSCQADLRALLGAFGVYRPFIPNYALLAAPLFKCLTKQEHVGWSQRWNEHCDTALSNLKLSMQRMAALELPCKTAEQALLLENDQHGFGAVFLQRLSPESNWKPIQFLSSSFRSGEKNKLGAERAVIACSYALKKMQSWINPQFKLLVFTNEPMMGWAMEPINVHGSVRRASMHLTQFELKVTKPPTCLKKLSQTFQFADPDRQIKVESLHRQRLVAQQRAIHLDEFKNTFLEDACVITFDGGYRERDAMGGYGWSIWTVKNDVWRLIRGEGCFTLDKTTVNVEEFAGLRNALQWTHNNLASLPEIHVFGDSKLVIGAMQGKLMCRAETMQVEYDRVKEIVRKIGSPVYFWHVLRDFNQVADFLANQAMDKRTTVVADDAQSELGIQLQDLLETSLKERIYMKSVHAVTRAQARTHVAEGASQVPIAAAEWARIRAGQLLTPWMKHHLDWAKTGCVPGNVKAKRALKETAESFAVYNGILWYVPYSDSRWKLVVPEGLRGDILREFHENAGHLRGQRFMIKIKERFYWPGLSRDVQHFEQSCIACQMGKTAKWRQTVPLSTLKELTWRPFQSIAVDSIVNLPLTLRGNRHLIVLVDYFSRWPVVIPVPDLSMLTWVKAFTERFITIYGCPERLVSDRGGQRCISTYEFTNSPPQRIIPWRMD